MGSYQEYIDILIDTMQKKQKVLEQLLAQTQKQEIIANSGTVDSEEFTNTLSEKDTLIQALLELDQGFDTLYERIRNELVTNKGQYIAQLRKLQEQIRTCTELGVQLQTLETRNRTKIAQLYGTRHKELRQVHTSSQAASNYYKSMSKTNAMSSYFMDKKY